MSNLDEIKILDAAMKKENALLDLIECGDKIFLNESNKKIYNILKELYFRGIQPTLNSVDSELRKKDLRETVFFDDFLNSLTQLNVIIDHSHILNNLKYEKKKNDLKNFSVDYLNKRITLDNFLDKTEALCEDYDIDEKDCSINIGDYAGIDIDDIFRNDVSVETNIPQIDNFLGGFFVDDLTIIAARPGEGKSTLALQIAKNVTGNVQVFSFEMTRRQIFAKYINEITGISALKILKKKLSYNEIEKINKAKDKIKNYNITVFDKHDDFRKCISLMKKEIKMSQSKMIIIDYLQLFSSSDGLNPNQKIELMSRELKKLSRDEHIPVIILSQLNRSSEKESRAPKKSDLRDSGAIEQDASVILFLHNNKIIVDKQRFGRTGEIEDFYFNREWSRFEQKQIEPFEKQKMFGYE